MDLITEKQREAIKKGLDDIKYSQENSTDSTHSPVVEDKEKERQTKKMLKAEYEKIKLDSRKSIK